MKIGYLGPHGSHSQAAAEVFSQQCCSQQAARANLLLPMMPLTHILDAVEEGALDIGCVPIENAIEGSVAEVLDGLTLSLKHTRIVAEFIRPIQHALIRKYEFVEGIEFIHSHPQAIGQCREAVYELLGSKIRFVPASSTSEAVKALLTLDETHAALGSPTAATHYGLETVIENIGNYHHNATRFLAVSALPESQVVELIQTPAESKLKTSICVGLHENRPGSLLAILTVLANLGLNLSKIESRPTKKSLGEYLFYLDIEGPLSADAEALIREQTGFYKKLGQYPSLGILL